MKVIQFINGLTSGGAETLVKDYVLHFPKDVESVVVLTNPYTGGPNEDAVRNAGIKIISISERLGWGGKRRCLPIRAYRFLMEKQLFLREFRKILREEKPDCIHAHLGTLHLLAGCIPQLKGIRILFTCHSAVSAVFPSKNAERAVSAIRLIDQLGMQIIALHPKMAAELNEFFGRSVSIVVNNGIDCRRFQTPGIDRTEFRKVLNIPENALVVGHVGRFLPVKNHAFLVDIFHTLRSRGVDAYLLMVGSGSLQQEIQNRLEALGLQEHYQILENRTDVPQLMSIMDVFVFPSTYEGFPLVLIEAQAAGLKCIISDAITDRVLLTDHILPLSLTVSAETWCDAILSKERCSPGNPNRLDAYDIRATVAQLKELYEVKNV